MTQVRIYLMIMMIMMMSGEYVCQITSEEGEVLEQSHRLQVITCHLLPPM